MLRCTCNNRCMALAGIHLQLTGTQHLTTICIGISACYIEYLVLKIDQIASKEVRLYDGNKIKSMQTGSIDVTRYGQS